MSLPKPYYEAEGVTLYLGDCRAVLPDLAAHEISAKRLEAASRGLSVKDITAGQRSIFDLIQGEENE